MLNRRIFLLSIGACSMTTATPLCAAEKIKPGQDSALIVVDVQNCFLPGGSLAVKDGDQIIPIINRLAKSFANVVITQDWHTEGHVSFASSHAGKKPFDVISAPYGDQVLWPDHCVQGTAGAEVSKDLALPSAQLIIRKGFHPDVDSYSAFLEADKKTETGLAGYLRERGVKKLFVTGLATDFCVAGTAIDGQKAGFDVSVVEDAVRGVNAPTPDGKGTVAKAWEAMASAGVKTIKAADIA